MKRHLAPAGAGMEVEQVKALCGAYPEASCKLFGPPGNVLAYYAGGRKFAYFKTSEPEQWRFSIRVPQHRFLELTDVPGIKPARYLARFHWITIVNVASMPAAELRQMVAWSHAAATTRTARSARRRRPPAP